MYRARERYPMPRFKNQKKEKDHRTQQSIQTIKVKALANTENWHQKALWYSILGTKGENDRPCILVRPLAS